MRTFLFGAVILAAIGCGDSGSGGSGGSGGAAGGSGGAPATGGAGGQAGADSCHGDATTWAAITAQPIACTKNSDCCVVVNTCTSEAQVVHADDYPTAGAAWPYCDNDCNLCIPPAVNVGCVNGACTGEVDDQAVEAGMDHCGVDNGPIVPVNPGVSFACGG
ncbi:MAG: hypothetical protein U0271_17650 [Polyangiaceae bacterium]